MTTQAVDHAGGTGTGGLAAASPSNLHRLAAFLGLLLAGFAALFGWQSWESSRAEQVAQMSNVLAVVDVALERYLTETEQAMKVLAADIVDAEGRLVATEEARHLLTRFQRQRPGLAAVSLRQMDGTLLVGTGPVRSTAASPSPSASYDAFLADLRQAEGLGLDLGRPVLGQLAGRWVIPMRLIVRDGLGRPVVVLTAGLPVEFLESFWKRAPIVEKVSIGLLGDDGFLRSRHPVPATVRSEQTYGTPRSGALREHLVQAGFPERGYVEGRNVLGGEPFGNAYQRMARYRMTLFVATPTAELRRVWWQRAQVPLGLLAFFAACAALVYRYMLRRQMQWAIERGQAEQRVLESKNFNASVIDSLTEHIAVLDAHGVIVAVNEAWRRFAIRSGAPASMEGFGVGVDYLGICARALDGPEAEDARKTRAGIQAVLDGESPEFRLEYPCHLVDELLWFQLNVVPMKGGIAGAVVSHNNITELKLAQDRTDRVNRSLRVLGSCGTGTLGFQDEQAYLEQVCRSVVAAGGYRMAWVGRANDDPEKSVRVVARAGADDGYLDSAQISWDSERVTGRGPFGMALRTGRTQINQDWSANPAAAPWREAAVRHGYGSSISLPLTLGPNVISVLSLYAAESDAFSPEEVPPLEELARNVAAGVEALQIRQQRDLAEGANRAKSEFLANMSHEIRTPLNAIVGLNYLIRRDGVTPVQAERLDKIDSAGQHLLSIINDILDLSKIEAGRVQIETTDFHLSAVLDAVQSIIAEPARAKGLAVSVDGSAVPLWLRGDPTRLRQALLNFAGNAVKFTEKGSIALRAELLEERGDDLRVRFSVTDTGIGLTPEQIPRLFQLFEQADASITRKFGGTGLGLVITKRLAELMQGECGVDSQAGLGSTFWFTAVLHRGHGILPAAAIESPATAEELLRRNHRGARVLLVEDNEVNREVALAMLHGVGLAVEWAADGQEAVAMAVANSYDVVLMDMQMPRMGGLEATRAIRRLEGWQARPILALTANAFDDDRLACRAAGMNDFIAKPMRADALHSALLKCLA